MISKLHFITQDHPVKTHQELVQAACRGGADWVQLRLKNKSASELKIISLEVLKICRTYDARLIINDHISLVKEIGADGVHLGKEDMSPILARKLLGINFIIGGTANTWPDIEKLHESSVDYIGLGPFRYTSTKEKLSPVLGLEGYKKLMSLCQINNITIPVIAIGGITTGDVAKILKTGIYGIALAGAVNNHSFPESAIQEFQELINSDISVLPSA
jgi:thiamine-phosphate pyrophosphorylase